MARYYIGGLLHHAPSLLAFTNPTVNSYHRLVPGFEAPVNLVYSQRNRSACIRIPITGNNPKAKRLEFRCPDPSSNPYLAFSAMLMAGLDGIKNKIEPPTPVDRDLYDLPPEELAQVPQVPGSLDEALAALGSPATRHFAIAVPFLILNIALTIILIVRVVSSGSTQDLPFGLIIALDHAMFVGTMTNVLFGVLFSATAGQRVWPWADDLIFWGMNLGVAVFIAALLADARDLERFTAPVMGAAVLLAIATFTLRLRSNRSAAPAPASA